MGISETLIDQKTVDTGNVAAIEQLQSQRKLKESKERARAKRKEQKKSQKHNRKAR